MAARLTMGIDAEERLRRLAVVFAVELRLKIVAELYMREMSAQLFFAEFGGGSLSRVSQNFTRLAREGWLRFLYSKGPGGTRHGGIEHFYRATEPPYFDAETWALLPYSVRGTASLNLFRQIAPRLRRDLELSADGGTEFERGLTAVPVVLDKSGWDRTIRAIGEQFTRLYEEQEDARRRSLQSGEELFRADVLLAAFQSPSGSGPMAANDFLIESPEPTVPFAERLAPILADEVRRDIVSQLNTTELSIARFHREFGGTSKAGVRRRFKGLEGGGWVMKSDSQRRRGATEQFYRATKPAIGSYESWVNLDGPLRESQEWQTFEYLCERVRTAMLGETFDALANRFLSWSMLRLDQQGWRNTLAGIEELSAFIADEERDAKKRIANSGDTPITMTVALAGFEAPSELVKAF